MTTNHTKCNQKQPDVSTFCNLTEQWKKGELPYGYYYIKTISGGEVIDRYYRDCTDYDLCEYGDVWENRFEDEIKEVLAPVPSYVEWNQLKKFLEEFNALDVAKENKLLKEDNRIFEEKIHNSYLKIGHLKELLSQIRNKQSLIREYLSDCKLGSAWDLLYQTENEIDNAIGEKK
jgi:hypothetical protein